MSKETNKHIIKAKDIPLHIKKKLLESKKEIEARQNSKDALGSISNTDNKKGNTFLDRLLYILPILISEKKENNEMDKNEEKDINNTNAIDEIIDLLNTDINDLPNVLSQKLDKVLIPKMDLDEIKNIYTAPLDKIIIRHEKETNNHFISGEFKVTYLDEKYYEVAYDLYFQNPNEKWIKMSSKSKPINIERKLKPEAIAELREKKNIVYEINPPSDDD